MIRRRVASINEMNDPMKNETAGRLKRHSGRNDLVGEHPLGDTVQVILIVIFLAVWISDSFVWHYSTFLNEYVSASLQLAAGAILALLACQLTFHGIRTVFVTVREKPEVLRKGVFSLIRHPIYLSAMLFYLSLVIFTLSLASLALWVIIVIFYVYISRYEEKALVSFFGQEYTSYQKDVPMFIPRLGLKNKTA
jgi:protein-S-isoprenylcysteine O-methyltransferase Ste14